MAALLCNGLVGALPNTHHVLQSSPMYRVTVPHPAQITASHGDRQKNKTKQNLCPGCPVHAAIGAFYSVMANRRQPDPFKTRTEFRNLGSVLLAQLTAPRDEQRDLRDDRSPHIAFQHFS